MTSPHFPKVGDWGNKPKEYIVGNIRETTRGMMKKPFYTWDGDTLVLGILGTPNAKRDAIGRVKGHQFCVSVTAVPHAGRATDHMVRFLADEFGVSVSDVPAIAEGAARVLAQCKEPWAREAIEESFIDNAVKTEILK